MQVRPALIVRICVALLVGASLGVLVQDRYEVLEAIERLTVERRLFYDPPPEGALTPVPAVEHQGRLSLFILAGQSNMSGRGAVPADEQVSDSRVYLFGNDYHWRLASEPTDDPRGQVDLVSRDLDAGYSPGMAFALALLERRPDLVIGLIPCAKGGSSIDLWRKSPSEYTLYGSCLRRALAASTMGELEGLLFFQGEADAMDPQVYNRSELYPLDWDARFVQLVLDLRRDLGSPDLPVVFAQIGTHTAPGVFVNWALVQERQRLVDLPHCAMITTADLALSDAVHFTPESYRAIGERFASAYLDLASEPTR